MKKERSFSLEELKDGLDLDYLPVIRATLAEDLGLGGDVTSRNLFSSQERMEGKIELREEGFLCGLALALETFLLLDPNLEFSCPYKDGQRVEAGGVVLELKGKTRAILTGERTALNFLGFLSGIATKTARFVEQVQGTGARILDTRKTLPQLRALQKYAVRTGGGFNHRMGLFDAVMIKDNHISQWGSISRAVQEVRTKLGHTVKIEVEADRLDQVQQALAAGADIVLLDNMDIPTLSKAVELCQGKIITEASGGVNLKSVRRISETGVDFISIGELTHSFQNLDFGLDSGH